jgi:hypothetical protein
VYGINRAIFEKLNSNNGNKQIQRMCEVASQQMRQKLSYVQDDPIIMMSTFLDPATKRHLKPADAEKATELVADWVVFSLIVHLFCLVKTRRRRNFNN